LSAVLVGNRVCRNAGGNFIVTGLSDGVRKLITISQLDQVLSISPDLDHALTNIVPE